MADKRPTVSDEGTDVEGDGVTDPHVGQEVPTSGHPTFINPDTVDRLIAVARTGMSWREAARSLGWDDSQVYRWRSMGLRERNRRREAMPPNRRYDLHVRLVDGIDTAREVLQREALERLESASRGGQERRRVTTVARRVVRPGQDPATAAEVIIDRTEVVESAPPDPKVDEWRLERIIGGRYRRRDHVTHHDGAELSSRWFDAFTAALDDERAALTDGQRDRLREVVAMRLREQVAAEALVESDA